jgi:hypothetical protein
MVRFLLLTLYFDKEDQEISNVRVGYAVLNTLTRCLSEVTNKIVFCWWLNSKNERRQ